MKWCTASFSCYHSCLFHSSSFSSLCLSCLICILCAPCFVCVCVNRNMMKEAAQAAWIFLFFQYKVDCILGEIFEFCIYGRSNGALISWSVTIIKLPYFNLNNCLFFFVSCCTDNTSHHYNKLYVCFSPTAQSLMSYSPNNTFSFNVCVVGLLPY